VLDTPAELDEDDAEGPDEELDTDVGGVAPAPDQPIVTSDDAMTLDEARTLTGRRGGRLVLLMGEASTGKTALSAALWQQMMEKGEIGAYRLAGSRTALGYERRAHWTRLEANQPGSDFPRTWDEDGGVVHLRVTRPDRERVELLLSDLTGEQFERIRKGRPLLEELPWAGRADRFAVLIDGLTLSQPGHSEVPLSRAQRQLQALQASRAVRPTARVAVLVTQADAITDQGQQALERHKPSLTQLAQAIDPEAVWLTSAAVPHDGSWPSGLEDVITWLCSDDRRLEPRALRLPEVTRAIGTLGLSGGDRR